MTRGPKLHCDSCPLLPSGIFRHLSGEHLRQLDASKVSHVLDAGQILFDEGAPPLATHCIRAGIVKVTKLGPGGEEQIIRVLRPADVVGYRAVLAGEPYGATAQALEMTMVCTVPAEILLALIRASSDFAIDVLAKVARELRLSEDALIDLRRKSVRQRLAGVLLLLSEARPAEPPRQHPHIVRLARRDLARLIATSPESISRALHRLAGESSIQCSRTEIRLLDLAALRRAAGGDPFSGLDRGQLGY
jgi:CRP/FNR family transcriptional regulator, polysaccharide utilization system transcription regulator